MTRETPRSGRVPTTEEPMPTDLTAADLHRRADELRRFAAHLDATPLEEMLHWAGADTWTSPRADELRVDLGVHRGRLRAASDDLRLAAHSLDARADAVDEQARLVSARAASVAVR
jgi:hypothetical protein